MKDSILKTTNQPTSIDEVVREYGQKSYELSMKAVTDHTVYPTVILQDFLREKLTTLVEQARGSVLDDFDKVCMADGFIGFSDQEWQAVKKFFAFNRAITADSAARTISSDKK